jgi:hypothetical protein
VNVGTLATLNSLGDTKISWDPANADEVEAARNTFNDLRAKGFLAFKVVGKAKGEQITAFDPEAKRIIMAPPMMGG